MKMTDTWKSQTLVLRLDGARVTIYFTIHNMIQNCIQLFHFTYIKLFSKRWAGHF